MSVDSGLSPNPASPTYSSPPLALSSATVDGSLDFLPEATRFDEALIKPLAIGIGEDILLPFVEEYAKLQQALIKSHDSETRFVNKCKALTKQTRAHTHKLTALHAMYLQDQKKKANYIAEIESKKQVLHKLQEEMKEKKEGVRELRQELQNLGQQLEESSNEFLRSQRNAIAKLELEVNKYSMIRDKDRTNLTKIRSKNIDLFKQLQDLLAALSRSQQEYDGLEAKLLEARALSGKELRRKAELEKNMKDIQARVTERQNQLQGKKELIVKATKELADVELQLSKSEKVVESHRIQYEELNESARNANESLLEIQESNEALAQQLKKVTRELDEDKGAVKQAKLASESKLKALEVMREKVKVLAEETRKEEDEKFAAQNQMKLLKDQISTIQFKLNSNAKAMDTCVREREVLAQNHMAKVDAIKAKEAALKIKNSTLKNIKNEHQGYLISIRALTKILEDLKRDKSAHESDLNRRLLQKARALEEVSQRELQITEYQSQILVNEGKLRQQQNLLEAVRSDRNMYRKQLIEQQTEMHEYKRKFHFLSTQVKQSKAEIEDKNQFIVFEHFNLQNVKDDIDQLEQQNSSTFHSLESADSVIKTQSQQIRKLSTIIADADEELRVQIKQYNAIVNEQRVLNQQLVKRNDELATLYEQLKLQNSILTKSASHYKEKQLLLQEFELEGQLVNKTLEEVLGDIKKYVELKDTIAEVESQLVQEQLKVKALSDELKKPINIHRWRRLMDTNTDTYGMIKKVRHLQKEIIEKTSLVSEKDKDIQEKEKLYVDLRRVLARQPGSEAAEQLRVYLEQLDEKRSKLKSMKAELKLYQTKVKEYQYDIGKLNQDLQLLKLTYFQRRRAQAKKQQNGGNGGGNGNRPMTGDDVDELPDILKPTEFPEYNYAQTTDQQLPNNNSNNIASSSSSSSQQPFQSSNVNPYLLSGVPNNSIGSSSSSLSSSNMPINNFPPSSNQSRVKGLDESSDEDDDDDDDQTGDDGFRTDYDEKQSTHASSTSSIHPSTSSSHPHSHSHSHRPLSASSRHVRTPSRPESRSSSTNGNNITSFNMSAIASNLPRTDSRQSARGNSAGGNGNGNQTQRGDANYSRFPAIGTPSAQQQSYANSQSQGSF